MTLFLALLLGLTAGLASGLFGIGGGIIMVPLMLILLKFEPQKAIGTSLAAMIPPVGLLGAREYWIAGRIDLPVAAMLALGILIGAYFGARLNLNLDPGLVKKVYGTFLVAMGVKMLFR